MEVFISAALIIREKKNLDVLQSSLDLGLESKESK